MEGATCEVEIQKRLAEALERRRIAEEHLKSCTVDSKSEAEYKLAEAEADLIGAEVALVEAQLSVCTEPGSHLHDKVKILIRRWNIAIQRLEELSTRKRGRSNLLVCLDDRNSDGITAQKKQKITSISDLFTEGGEGCSEAGERRLRLQSKELELPPTWCNQTEPIEIFPVQPDEADFDKAKNILFNSGPNATLNESAFQIHCVRRVQNLPAYERYALERKLLIQLRSAGACEPASRAFSCDCAGAACMA